MRLSWGFLLAAPAWAHVVSMSTGEFRVDGPTAVYELRIPMYEAAHVSNPETALIDHVRFIGAHRTSSKCHEEDGTYVCVASYEFPTLIDRVDVECTLYQVTVPNHVHLLRAVQGSNSDEAVFDQTITREVIRFRPPSRLEIASRDAAAGIHRAIASPAVLFLLILILAARSGREAVVLGGDVSGGRVDHATDRASNPVAAFAEVHRSGDGANGRVPGAGDSDAAECGQKMGGSTGARVISRIIFRIVSGGLFGRSCYRSSCIDRRAGVGDAALCGFDGSSSGGGGAAVRGVGVVRDENDSLLAELKRIRDYISCLCSSVSICAEFRD